MEVTSYFESILNYGVKKGDDDTLTVEHVVCKLCGSVVMRETMTKHATYHHKELDIPLADYGRPWSDIGRSMDGKKIFIIGFEGGPNNQRDAEGYVLFTPEGQKLFFYVERRASYQLHDSHRWRSAE